MTLEEFETQTEKYRERLTKIARKWVGDHAEDVVQTLYIGAWKRIDSLTGDIGNYLYGGLRWRCRDLQLKLETEGELLSQYARLTPAESPGPGADDPCRDLETALAALRESERATVKGELAGEGENGEPVPLSVRLKRHRVKKKLRVSLKDYAKESRNS